MKIKYNIIKAMVDAQETVKFIRRIRQEYKIKNNVVLDVYVEPIDLAAFAGFYSFAEDGWFKNMANIRIHIRIPEKLLSL